MESLRDVPEAQKHFDAGVLALGLPVNGRQVSADHEYARQAFRKATTFDPTMSDAWLGLVIAGETSPEVLQNLSSTALLNLGEQQRRLNLAPRQFQGAFHTGYAIEYSLHSLIECQLAYAAKMIIQEDYSQAGQIFENIEYYIHNEAITSVSIEETEILTYMKSLMHFRLENWAKVIELLHDCHSWHDEYAAAGAHFMLGNALAQQGKFREAIEELTYAENCAIPAVRLDALFAHGLILREMGQEENARTVLKQVYATDPNHQGANKALKDPTYRLLLATYEQADQLKEKNHIPVVKFHNSKNRKTNSTGYEVSGSNTISSNTLIAEQVETELEKQIGLEAVKRQLEKLKASVGVAKTRLDRGVGNPDTSFHLTFTGPPGTGKTTIAAIIAKIYCSVGLLKTEQIVELHPYDFFGSTVDDTIEKTSDLLKQARNSVVFIRQAYLFSKEKFSRNPAIAAAAIDTLLAYMEDNKNHIFVILSGYDAEIDNLLQEFPGLSQQFTKRICFQSYSPEELTAIAQSIAQRKTMTIDDDALQVFHQYAQQLCTEQVPDIDGVLHKRIDIAGNGKFAHKVVEDAINEYHRRVHKLCHTTSIEYTNNTPPVITAEDMHCALHTSQLTSIS